MHVESSLLHTCVALIYSLDILIDKLICQSFREHIFLMKHLYDDGNLCYDLLVH